MRYLIFLWLWVIISQNTLATGSEYLNERLLLIDASQKLSRVSDLVRLADIAKSSDSTLNYQEVLEVMNALEQAFIDHVNEAR